jgi:hypothetical protein
VDLRHTNVDSYDIISHRWYPAEGYTYGYHDVRTKDGNIIPGHQIQGLDWMIDVSHAKITHMKNFMIASGVEYLWVDCICIRQDDEDEKDGEVQKMFDYYKAARTCHVLMNMAMVWDPHQIVKDLKLVDHVLSHVDASALASEAPNLSRGTVKDLDDWASKPWVFPVSESMVRSAAIDMGLINCYSTSALNIMSVFRNEYFTRVWTFQEMILGKNIRLWAIDHETVADIGELDTWMDLATNAADRAYKLFRWIDTSWKLKPASVLAIMRVLVEDLEDLKNLQLVVKGIESARTDIISGGPRWWHDNPKGISNIFSAISVLPRSCFKKHDYFRGLLGIFDGLFDKAEMQRELTGDDVETMSFCFFKQLSIKTGFAWTNLAVSSQDRGEYDWIPMVRKHNQTTTADCFAGVMKLGRLRRKKGQAIAEATTKFKGSPQKFASITLLQNEPKSGYRFIFKGCNCGKTRKTGLFSREPIETVDATMEVYHDDTARTLVHCATLLGCLLDPCPKNTLPEERNANLVRFRKSLLHKLQPSWQISDPNAKPAQWEDRCVSGTSWEDPNPDFIRVHNCSFSYKLASLDGFDCRLATAKTAEISCKVEMNCGCVYIAPFAFIFYGLTSVRDCSLGQETARRDGDDRIILQDGLGLVQIGDVGKTFNLIAFDGNIGAYKSYASLCRKKWLKSKDIPVWPSGRALVSEGFSHSLLSLARNYGFVETGGSGNLLICRKHPLAPYRIIGACIDEEIQPKKQDTRPRKVKIR